MTWSFSDYSFFLGKSRNSSRKKNDHTTCGFKSLSLSSQDCNGPTHGAVPARKFRKVVKGGSRSPGPGDPMATPGPTVSSWQDQPPTKKMGRKRSASRSPIPTTVAIWKTGRSSAYFTADAQILQYLKQRYTDTPGISVEDLRVS